MIKEIESRRSIRKYSDMKIPKVYIETILKAGMLAPSSKNRQPWKFIVAEGNSKKEAVEIMRKGIKREKQNPLMPGCLKFIDGAVHTADIIEQAPVIIFVINPLSLELNKNAAPEERISDICNAQSIGAALENMTLTANHLGFGSLWICDTFFAQQELNSWLNCDGELYAALAIGYPLEHPHERPRKALKDIVEWRL